MSIVHEKEFNDEEYEEERRIDTEHDSICISLPVKLLARIDYLRGDTKRSTYIASKLQSVIFPSKTK